MNTATSTGSLLFYMLCAGCSADGDLKAPPTGLMPSPQLALQAAPSLQNIPTSLGPIETVSAMQRRFGSATLLGHAPADTAFASLKSAFATNRHQSMRVAVYDLAPVGRLATVAGAKASALGFDIVKSTSMITGTGDVLISDGTWDLTLDSKTGGEFYVDPSRHHKGVATNSLFGDDVYAQKAAAYIASTFTAPSGPQSVFASQLHHYHNSTVSYSVGGDPATRGPVSDGVYEIAVVHNTALDGLPVIGPGGRYKVWMSPGGAVVAHKSSVRAVGARRAILTGAQLVDPATAQAGLEAKLTARGVNLSNYTLSEAQFGYLQRDNGAMQRLVAPYFIFVYTPVAKSQKLVVETVPAVSDPTVLSDILADEAAEAATRPAVPLDTPKTK